MALQLGPQVKNIFIEALNGFRSYHPWNSSPFSLQSVALPEEIREITPIRGNDIFIGGQIALESFFAYSPQLEDIFTDSFPLISQVAYLQTAPEEVLRSFTGIVWSHRYSDTVFPLLASITRITYSSTSASKIFIEEGLFDFLGTVWENSRFYQDDARQRIRICVVIALSAVFCHSSRDAYYRSMTSRPCQHIITEAYMDRCIIKKALIVSPIVHHLLISLAHLTQWVLLSGSEFFRDWYTNRITTYSGPILPSYLASQYILDALM